MLKALEGGCQVPIGAYGEIKENELHLSAMVGSLDGKTVFKKTQKGEKTDPEETGEALAGELLQEGADRILKEIYEDLRK